MVFCINAVVADHFKMPVRDMYDQPFDKVNPKEGSWQWIILSMLSKTFLPGRITYWMFSKWSEKIVWRMFFLHIRIFYNKKIERAPQPPHERGAGELSVPKALCSVFVDLMHGQIHIFHHRAVEVLLDEFRFERRAGGFVPQVAKLFGVGLVVV